MLLVQLAQALARLRGGDRHGLLGAHVRPQLGRIAQRTLDDEDQLALADLRIALGQHDVIDAAQSLFAGQHRQAGAQALAVGVEGPAQVGFQAAHAGFGLLGQGFRAGGGGGMRRVHGGRLGGNGRRAC